MRVLEETYEFLTKAIAAPPPVYVPDYQTDLPKDSKVRGTLETAVLQAQRALQAMSEDRKELSRKLALLNSDAVCAAKKAKELMVGVSCYMPLATFSTEY